MSIVGRLVAIPRNTLILSVGLGIVGITTYLFLLVAGQMLGDEKYAPLGALWLIVYLVAPGFFFPIEQEVTRAYAARRAHGQSAGPVFGKALRLTLFMATVLMLLAIATFPFTLDALFDGQWLLGGAFVLSLMSFALAYLVRGVLAGSGQLGAYGLLITVEGVSRLLAALALAVTSIDLAGPYGVLVALAPAIAMISVIPYVKKTVVAGPSASIRSLTASLRELVAAAVFSQTLINVAPLIVKSAAAANEQANAGAFAKAVIITRIPLFLFQAVQAAMLPKLTGLAASGNMIGFRTTVTRLIIAVAVVAAIGSGLIVGLSPLLLELFGSEGLPRTDMALLGAGNAMFFVAMTAAQALISLSAQRATVWGWGSGLLGFLVLCFVPLAVVLRVELALIVGATIAVTVMLVLLRKRVSEVEHNPHLINEVFVSPTVEN